MTILKPEDTGPSYERSTRHGWATGLHLVFWLLLFVGFWLHWPPSMLVGFALTVGNVTSFGLLFLGNLAVAIAVMIANPQSAEGENLIFASMMCLIAQVWQFCVWIQGAAAH